MKWKKEEIEKAKMLIQKELTWEEIGNKMNRTPKSVRLKMNKLGFHILKNYEFKIIETIECKECGEEFKAPKLNNRKFCNNSCSASFNNRNVRRNYNPDNYIKNKCKNCDNTIYGKNRKYCNAKCQQEKNWKEKKKEIELGKINSRRILRKYLLEKEGNKCKICKKNEWNGKEIPLVLDHINGDSYNNNLINLRLICPNCDAQTEFYKGKNIGRGRKERMERYYSGKSY